MCKRRTDRPLLVSDPARVKALWPVIGRPGAILADCELADCELADCEIAGLWRPRQSGGKLTVRVALWTRSGNGYGPGLSSRPSGSPPTARYGWPGVEVAAA